MAPRQRLSIDELDELAEKQRKSELRERRARAQGSTDHFAKNQVHNPVTRASDNAASAFSDSDDSFVTPSSSEPGSSDDDSSSDEAHDLGSMALQISDRKRRRVHPRASSIPLSEARNFSSKLGKPVPRFLDDLGLEDSANPGNEMEFDLSEYADVLKRVGQSQHEAFRTLIDRYDGESDGDVVDLRTGMIVKDSGHLHAIPPQHRILDVDSDAESSDSDSEMKDGTPDDLGVGGTLSFGSVEQMMSIMNKGDGFGSNAINNQLRERPAPILDQLVDMLTFGGIR